MKRALRRIARTLLFVLLSIPAIAVCLLLICFDKIDRDTQPS